MQRDTKNGIESLINLSKEFENDYHKSFINIFFTALSRPREFLLFFIIFLRILDS